jgi:large conductance mechanosensitive channel
MNGLVLRIRGFLRRESIGVTIPFAVVLLWAFWSLILAFVGATVLPPILKAFEDDDGTRALDFTISDIHFDFTNLVYYLVSFVLLAAIAGYVFVRQVDGDFDDDEDMRECPECRSKIFLDATRCAFCTAIVPPTGMDVDQ